MAELVLTFPGTADTTGGRRRYTLAGRGTVIASTWSAHDFLQPVGSKTWLLQAHRHCSWLLHALCHKLRLLLANRVSSWLRVPGRLHSQNSCPRSPDLYLSGKRRHLTPGTFFVRVRWCASLFFLTEHSKLKGCDNCSSPAFMNVTAAARPQTLARASCAPHSCKQLV